MPKIDLRMDPIRVETAGDYGATARLTVSLTTVERSRHGRRYGDVVMVDMAFARGSDKAQTGSGVFGAEDAKAKAIRLLHEALRSLEKWNPDQPC